MKKGKIESDELGMIEFKSDRAFIAVSYTKANGVCEKLSKERLKKKKIRVYTI